jgi:hypothetical protein
LFKTNPHLATVHFILLFCNFIIEKAEIMNDTPSIKQIIIDFILHQRPIKKYYLDKIEYQPIVDFIALNYLVMI